ncbi:flagellar basal body P-ring formation chaperone FlgA [Lichenihabitans sp. Uapishka_5]|uniref:flagellar basal body P-ring formation chaperone FlgA n=1 Tax=Lichenihabitans sp. Uapishka_5 TaxID=3037302 RepID=UPI0029E81801|nr:flagellar basal body P-ring formation chaperone FlgA [Lichenihabitans sp. Uapishka_5]MDX7952986.1 flagellar basal body P-ring formation chaperone FlgA [Lichenihabitans sp. Uapishka_5]
MTLALSRALALLAAALAVHSGTAAEAAQAVPVASVTIYPGDIIRDGMLTERDLPDNFPGQAVTALDRTALVGKTVRRTLLPGLPIPINAVAEPKVVSVGAMVRVVYVEGDLNIATYASALQAGGVGDTIAVRNPESGLTISGVIAKDGTVRIGTS